MNEWPVEHLRGDGASLHGRDALERPSRRVDVLHVDRPCLVLGSTQSTSIVSSGSARESGVAVVRRRTGGGAVYLDPGQHVWIDVVISSDDPLWKDDVASAFTWLGGAWAAALADIGVTDAVVNDNAVCRSPLGRLICFAGLGYGEVSDDVGKVVGLAQRRTRAGAWFQSAVVRRWDTEPYARLLSPALTPFGDDPDGSIEDVHVRPVPNPADEVVDALVRHLPR
jgi:lipoate---protein ligase